MADCKDQRRNKHGVVVVTCSLQVHTDPEHVDMHAGASWVNVPRDHIPAIRTAQKMMLDTDSLN